MFKSFFAARDALDVGLDTGQIKLSSTENAVFRYLLEHTLYKPRSQEHYGFVNFEDAGVERIAIRTSLSERTIIRMLGALEDKGMMGRWALPVIAGGRQNDLIEMDWVKRHARARGAEGDTRSPSLPDTVSPSYLYEEDIEEATTAGGEHD